MRKNNTLRIKLNRLLVVTIICTILVQNILPGLSVFASESASDGEMEISATPEVSSTPEISENPETSSTPKVSETPEASSTPEVSGTPEASSTPEVSEAPEVSSIPEVSENPEASSTPEVSETPEASSTPEVSETPEVSSTPEVSETPEVSSTPEVSETPEVSSTPEVSETPEVSSTPEVSETPEISKAPELSLDMPLGSFAPSNSMMLGSTNEITSDAEEINDLTFDPNTQTITDCVDNPTKDLVIPAQIGGKDVLHIADGVLSARGLTSVTFEKGSKLKTIGSETFYNNPAITSVTLPDTVTSIGTSAFENCTGLATITIPGGVTEIKSNTFKGCGKLSNVIATGVTTIGTSAFQSCSVLKTVGFLQNVTSIGDSAFYSAGITSVMLGETLKKIGNSAFYNCNIASEVIIPDSVTTLGTLAFANNEFKKFTFGDGIKNIPSSILSGCSYLQVIYLPFTESEYFYLSNLGSYGARVFAGSIMEGDFLYEINSENQGIVTGYIGEEDEITIPASFTYNEQNITVTTLESELFYGNKFITKITLPSTITQIGSSAFYDCYKLKEVDLSKTTITEVASSTFYSCNQLQTVTLPNSVTEIGVSAFYYCDNLTTIDMPTSLVSINSSAFGETYALNTIDLSNSNSLTTIGNSAFYYGNLTSITLPESLTNIGYNAFYLCEIMSITLPESLESIGSTAFYSNDIEEIIIPSKVTTINSSLFSNCNKLKTVTFDGEITSIGSSAFSGTIIEEITIPSSITSIYSSAFSGANSLKKITIGKAEDSIENAPWGSTTATVYWNDTAVVDGYIFSTKNNEIRKYIGEDTGIMVPNTFSIEGVEYPVKHVADYAFANCKALTKVDISNLTFMEKVPNYMFYQCSALEEVVLPNCIKEIGTYAFYYDQKLKTIRLPDGLTTINDYAFNYCSELASINIPSTVKMVGERAFSSSGITSFNFASVEKIESYAFYSSKLAGTVVLSDNLTSLGSSAFSSTHITSITFPDHLITLPSSIVSECSSLTEINMGDNITSIGSSAFASCSSLESVRLSKSLTSIQYKTFYSCTKLSSLVIPDSVKSINSYYSTNTGAFYNCSALTSLTLPEGLTSIDCYAFWGSGIKQLQIPSTVTSMATTALSGMSSLTTGFVNQTRGDQTFHKNSPWGAPNKPTIYFKGEAIIIKGELALSADAYKCELRLWAEEEEGLIVKEILYPEGIVDANGNSLEKGSNVGGSTWSETVYVTENGSYTFRGLAKEVYSEFTFIVDGIGKPVITTDNSLTVTPMMVQQGLTEEQIIEALQATASDGVDNNLKITLAAGDVAAVNALTTANASTTITLSATSPHKNDTTTKKVIVSLLTRDKITITDHNQNKIYTETLDVERVINIMNSEDNDPTDTYKVGYVGAIELAEPFVKTGFTFNKWVVTAEENGPVVVTPTYTINRYEVEFDSTGGAYRPKQICDYNTTATKPTDPTRNWYAFEGWYEEDTLQTEYDFDDKITDDITLYAKWSHVHNLAYTQSNDVITATCIHTNEDCAYHSNNYVAGKLTLNTPASLVAQDGTKEFTVTKDSNWKQNILDEITLKYFESNALLTEVPTTRGNYTVKVLVGDETVLTKNYEITNAIIQPETVFKNYDTVSSAWTNTKITFEQSESNYTFCTSENGTYTDTISFTDLNDGTETKQVYVRNSEDGVIYLTTLTYKLENTTPTFTISGEPTTWQNEDVVLTVSATDLGGSGLASNSYSYDKGTTWVADARCTYTENKEIQIWVKDVAGNITKQTIDTLFVDQTAPSNIEVTLNSETPTGSSGWYKDEVRINLVLPINGVKEAPITSYYKLWKTSAKEPSQWTEITANGTLILEDGNWNLKTYTIDDAGNASAESAVITWKQDTTKPVINGLDFDTTKTFLDWILGSSSVEITVNVEDELSGTETVVATLTEEGVSGDSTKTLDITNNKAALTISANWKGTISFKVVDEAGLVSEDYTIAQAGHDGIMVENTKPEITASEPTPNEDNWYKEDVTIEVEATDKELSSGLESITYQINSETPVKVTTGLDTSFVATYDLDIVFDEDGEYVVVINAKDHASNEANTVTTSTIKLDKTAPTIRVDYKDDTWTNEDYMYIDFGVSDAGSGIDQIKVYKGQEEYQVTDSNGGKTFRVEENESYTIEVTDVAGNVETEVVAVTKFDRITPDIEWTAQTQLLSESTWYGKNQLINQILAVESTTTQNVGAPIEITYVIDEEVVSETVDVASLTTGTHTIKATIMDAAGNDAGITRVIKVDNVIDEFNTSMVGIDESAHIDTIAEIKSEFDNYTQVQVARILTNKEAKDNYDTLLSLYKKYEEAIALEQKILAMEQVIEEAYASKDHWVNKTALALFEKLSEEEKLLISADVITKHDEIEEDWQAIDGLIAKINDTTKTSDASYIEKIEELDAEVKALSTNTGTTLPVESDDLLDTLVTYKNNAVNVSNMPLTTLDETRAAKVAYEALSTYEKGMVDGKAIDTAYNSLLAALEAEQKAKEQFIVLLEKTEQYPTVTGIEQLEASFDQLTENAKTQLTAGEQAAYETLVDACTQDIEELIENLDQLDITNRVEVDKVLGEYKNVTDVNQQRIIENSVKIDVDRLQDDLTGAKDLEDKVNAISETSNVLDNRTVIENIKIQFLLLSDDAIALVDPAVIEKIDRLYDELLKVLEYKNSAHTAKSSVEIIGLAENIALPESAKDMVKTTVSVAMKDSLPEVVPEVVGKNLMSSADIKLLCTLVDEDGNVYEQYVQPKVGQSVVVKLEIQKGYDVNTLEIFHVKDNGKREIVPIKEIVYENGTCYVIFEISSFSHFMVYASKIVIPPVINNNTQAPLEESEEIIESEKPVVSKEVTVQDIKSLEESGITVFDKVTENITPEEEKGEVIPEVTEKTEILPVEKQELEEPTGMMESGRYIGWGLIIIGLGIFFFFILWKRRKKEEDEEMNSEIKKMLSLFLVIGISLWTIGCGSLEEEAKRAAEQAAKEMIEQAAHVMIDEIAQSIEEDGVNTFLEKFDAKELKEIVGKLDPKDLEEFKLELEEIGVNLEEIIKAE